MNKAFELKHIVILLISIAIITVGAVLTKKMKLKDTCKALFIIGIISEIVKIIYYTVANEDKFRGVLPKSDLPFHLCSIQIIFIAIVTLSKNEKLKKFILSFMIPSCLIGGFAAILLPTTSALNTWPITIQYFLYHASLVIFAIYLLVSKEIKLDISDYFNCLKFLLLLFFFAVYINSIVYDGVSNINFMYVVGPPMEGLPFLSKEHGWLVYIFHYALLVLACVTICYIKPIIDFIKQKRIKNK